MLNKFKNIIAEVNEAVKEREEFIKYLAVAILTRWNIFAYGDTGQAKSATITEFRNRIIGAKQFSIQITKQTDLEEIFGRLDIQSVIQKDIQDTDQMKQIKADINNLKGQYERTRDSKILNQIKELIEEYNILRDAEGLESVTVPKILTAGKAADAHYVVLDEVFDGNDSTLRGMNTAMNERKYTNEGTTLDIPAEVFLAASNRVPDLNDPEDNRLKAMYDRFHFKVMTRYIENEKNALAVIKAKKEISKGKIKPPTTITLDEIHQMQDEVKKVVVPDDLDEIVWNVVQELRGKDIHVSDRKYLDYFPAVQAVAYLDGRNVANAADLMILKNMFWNKPEEIETVEGVLKNLTSNLLKTKSDEILAMAMESYDQTINADISDMVKKNKQIKKFRSEIVRVFDMLNDLQPKATTAKDQDTLKKALDKVEGYNKEVHDKYGYTYTPLAELKSLM